MKNTCRELIKRSLLLSMILWQGLFGMDVFAQEIVVPDIQMANPVEADVIFFGNLDMVADYLLLEEGSNSFTYLKFKRLAWLRRNYYALRQAQEGKLSEKDVSAIGVDDGIFNVIPDDPYFSSSELFSGFSDMWAWKQINIEGAWELATGMDIIVAVLDSGIDYNHPEIISQLYYNTAEIAGDGIDNDGNSYVDDYMGWDFVGTDVYIPLEDNDVIDNDGHGTHVSGIIAAADNSEGIIGVSPEAKILPIKVLDDEGLGSEDILARGIRYAADMGAKVINISLGGLGYASSFLVDMVSYAINKGCIIVAAAGNSNDDVDGYLPANMENIVTVSATDPDDDITWFSNYGSSIDVAAPGAYILSLRAQGTDMYEDGNHFAPPGDTDAEYYWANGTSMSAPFVSGLAALMSSQDTELTYDDFVRRLRFSSADFGMPGWDEYYGWGRIDAFKALSYDWYDSGKIKTWWLTDLITSYYESGNIKSYVRDNSIHTFMDEDYYGCTQDPAYEYGTGRLEKYEYFDGDGVLIDYVKYEYYGDTLNVKKSTRPVIQDGAIVPGSEWVEEFYNEEFVNNPRFAVDSGGNILTAAQIYSDEGWTDMLIKRDVSGTVLWKKEHDVRDWIRGNLGVLVDENDNVFVTGHIWNGTDMDLVIYAYDSDGNSLGSYQYDSGKEDIFAYLSFDHEGNIIVSGHSGYDEDSDIFIAKIQKDLSGLIWDDVYDSGIRDSVRRFQLDSDGNISLYFYKFTSPGSGGDACRLVYTNDGILTDMVEANDSIISFEGALRGSWVVGRSFEYTENTGDYPVVNRTLAYQLDTGKSLIGTSIGDDSIVPLEFGEMTYYIFMDPMTGEEISAQVRFDNGVEAEVNFGSEEGEVFITKVEGYDENIYWFLWDVEYAGVPNQYTVIEKSPENNWTAYNFDSAAGDFESLMQGWGEIGPVADPDLLELPELGDWWQYCTQNRIVPVFPPLSSDYSYVLGRVIEQVDHNPYITGSSGMDTTYTYEWDDPVEGQVKMSISYDYDQNGSVDLIYTGVYENGFNYDLVNRRSWKVISENYIFGSGEIYTYYDISGFLESKILLEADEWGNVYYYYKDEPFYTDSYGYSYGRLEKQISADPLYEGYTGVKYEYYDGTDTVRAQYCYANADYSNPSNPVLTGLITSFTYYSTPWLLESQTGGNEYIAYRHFMEEEFYDMDGGILGRTDTEILTMPDEEGAGAYAYEYYSGSDIIRTKSCYQSGEYSDTSNPVLITLLHTYTYYNTLEPYGLMESKTFTQMDEYGNMYYYYEEISFYQPMEGASYGRLKKQVAFEVGGDGAIGYEYEYYDGTDTIKRKYCYGFADYSNPSDPVLMDLVATYEYSMEGLFIRKVSKGNNKKVKNSNNKKLNEEVLKRKDLESGQNKMYSDTDGDGIKVSGEMVSSHKTRYYAENSKF